MNIQRLGVGEDDQAVADAVARFAADSLAPRAQAIDEEALSATCHLPGLAALGVMGMNLPEHLGGPGVTPTAMLLSLVAISRACAATSSMIGAHYLGTDALLIGGDARQHRQWLPRCASGEWLAGFALTEPGGGSHPADLRTVAQRAGDGYRLTGSKQFISNAAEARFLIVFAKTDPQAGARGVSAFIVPTDSP
ncbi:MAG TPA: acyl-CoA dehydrogenase family protein, partial [Pseudorhodoferax sp.]|nr:acyl-CoA dehydrogenase family protein [Pseudorhodoferax sp.]